MADTIKLLLVVNVSAAIGAFNVWFQDRIGHKSNAYDHAADGSFTVVIALCLARRLVLGGQFGRTCLGASQSAAARWLGYWPASAVAGVLRLWGLVVRLAGVSGWVCYWSTWLLPHRGDVWLIGLVLLAPAHYRRRCS